MAERPAGHPRLGAAGVTVSISDRDGFRVVHKDGGDLVHIPADQLRPGDWDAFWAGIQEVQSRACLRQQDQAA